MDAAPNFRDAAPAAPEVRLGTVPLAVAPCTPNVDSARLGVPGAAERVLAAVDEALHLAEEEAGGELCAVCLGLINENQAALVPGCDHTFCVNCILGWLTQKKVPAQSRADCPLCKREVDTLWTYRLVDGTYDDYLVETSADLLLRATWFRREARLRLPIAVGEAGPIAGAFTPDGWTDEEYHAYLRTQFGVGRDHGDDDDLSEDEGEDEDEELLRRVAGRLGNRAFCNRAFGRGGFLSEGRRAARPARVRKGDSSGGSGHKAGKAAAGTASTPAKGKVATSRTGCAGATSSAHLGQVTPGACSSGACTATASVAEAPLTYSSRKAPTRVVAVEVTEGRAKKPAVASTDPAAQLPGGDHVSKQPGLEELGTSPTDSLANVMGRGQGNGGSARGRRSTKRHARMQKKLEAQQQKAAARASMLAFRVGTSACGGADDGPEDVGQHGEAAALATRAILEEDPDLAEALRRSLLDSGPGSAA